MLQRSFFIRANITDEMCIRVNSVVIYLSPLDKATASARIALEIVYPGHNPAPYVGCFASSACRPTFRQNVVQNSGKGRKAKLTHVEFKVIDIPVKCRGSSLHSGLRKRFNE